MEYDLFSMPGHLLNYPHYTFWNWRENFLNIVTHPDKRILVGDVVFVNGVHKPATVVEILEERKAKGNHVVNFEPLFQQVKIEPIKEVK